MNTSSQTEYAAGPARRLPIRQAPQRVEFGSGVSATRLAVADFARAIALWRLWVSMGWQDIKQRYRRSMLGPFWLTLSMAITIGALGFLYGQLFGIELAIYLPFLTLGFIIWGFISSIITDGCSSLIAAEGFIRQVRLPFMLHALRCVWRNLIMLAHNAVVFIPVVIIFQIWPGWPILLVIPGMVLLTINAVWVTLLLGAVCARFRDIPPIAASLVQVAFFLTPIIWMPELLRERVMFAEANPFYHFVEILRAPLLGIVPQMQTYNVVIGVTVVGWAVTWLFFRRFRCRLAYWI
jgi:ABC-2 type transport system permease protein/lipopolysaccharide transport system permease protein